MRLISDAPLGVDPSWLSAATPFIAALVVAGISTTVCLLALNRAGIDLDVGRAPLRFRTSRRPPPARSPEQQYAAAFERYADLGRALGAVLEAAPDLKDKVARDWFTLLCQALSQGLSTGTTETFRVAVWNLSDINEVTAIATHLLSTTVGDRRLPADRSKAGQCIADHAEVYVADINSDATFDKLGDPQKVYSSLVAVPCGPRDDPWGAITVDAKGLSVFTDVDRELVRRFAALADVGMVAWDSQMVMGFSDDSQPAT